MLIFCFFFFKQKTAYEMRISDWSSDVCSSDLSAQDRIHKRDRTRESLDGRRRQLMGILQSGGALEHYALLQQAAGRAEADAEGLTQRLKTAEAIESTKAVLDIEPAPLTKTRQAEPNNTQPLIKRVNQIL